jgi:hypothetical protein
VDVTIVRQFIEEYRARTGEQLSCTCYLIFCLTRAVDEPLAADQIGTRLGLGIGALTAS